MTTIMGNHLNISIYSRMKVADIIEDIEGLTKWAPLVDANDNGLAHLAEAQPPMTFIGEEDNQEIIRGNSFGAENSDN